MIHAFAALDRDQRLLSLSFFFWGFGQGLFFYIQPLYIAQLGATPAQIGYVLSLSGLAVTAIYIPMGWWADRRGRKPVMIAGWSMGIFAGIGMAIAPDWRWVIPAQTAYWLANFSMPAANGYIAATVKEGHADRTFTAIWGSSSVGSIISPALGGWIGDQLGFRAVYVATAVFFGLSTLMVALLHDQAARPPRATAARGRLLARPAFVSQIILTLLVFFAIDVGQVMAPNFMQDVRDLSLTQIGWLGTVGTLGIVVFMFLYGHLPVDRPWAVALSQISALAAVSIWLAVASPALLAAAYFIHGSDRVIRPSLLGQFSRNLDAETMSFGYGFYETAMRSGLAISPYVAGLLYTQSPAWPLYASIIGLAVTSVLTWLLPPSTRPRQSAARLP